MKKWISAAVFMYVLVVGTAAVEANPITEKETIAPSKPWIITFNTPMNKEYIENRIYVLNEENEKVSDVSVTMHNKKVVIQPPEKGYETGNYQLVISEQVESEAGLNLGDSLTKDFTVKDLSIEEQLAKGIPDTFAEGATGQERTEKLLRYLGISREEYIKASGIKAEDNRTYHLADLNGDQIPEVVAGIRSEQTFSIQIASFEDNQWTTKNVYQTNIGMQGSFRTIDYTGALTKGQRDLLAYETHTSGNFPYVGGLIVYYDAESSSFQVTEHESAYVLAGEQVVENNQLKYIGRSEIDAFTWTGDADKFDHKPVLRSDEDVEPSEVLSYHQENGKVIASKETLSVTPGDTVYVKQSELEKGHIRVLYDGATFEMVDSVEAGLLLKVKEDTEVKQSEIMFSSNYGPFTHVNVEVKQ